MIIFGRTDLPNPRDYDPGTICVDRRNRRYLLAGRRFTWTTKIGRLCFFLDLESGLTLARSVDLFASGDTPWQRAWRSSRDGESMCWLLAYVGRGDIPDGRRWIELGDKVLPRVLTTEDEELARRVRATHPTMPSYSDIIAVSKKNRT